MNVRQIGKAKQAGVTLVELLMTVTLLAILISTAIPNLQRLLDASQATGQANEINAILGLARTEALQRFAPAIVEPSGGTWNDGTWVVGVDGNADGSITGDEILHRMDMINASAFAIADTGGNALTQLSFDPRGWPITDAVIDFRKNDCQRIITLRPSGNISVQKVDC